MPRELAPGPSRRADLIAEALADLEREHREWLAAVAHERRRFDARGAAAWRARRAGCNNSQIGAVIGTTDVQAGRLANRYSPDTIPT